MPADLKSLTVDDAAGFADRLDADVAPRLGLSPDPFDVDSKWMIADADKIARSGTIQSLQDLGYLPEPPTGVATVVEESQLAAAIAHWRFDCRRFKALYRFRAEDPEAFVPVSASTVKEPLTLLLVQTGYDGDLWSETVPEPGEPSSLASRILLFRLKTFNRYEGLVDEPLSQESYDTFQRLRQHFGKSATEGDLNLFNRLGNGRELSEVFCPRHRDHLFVTMDSDPSLESDLPRAEHFILDRKKMSTDFRHHQGRNNPARKKSANSVVLRYRPRRRPGLCLEECFESDANSLGLELLQLRLWQHGFYQGAIDADWGDLSQEGLEDFISSFHSEFDLKREDFLAYVAGGKVLNLAFILEDLMQIAETTAESIEKNQLKEIAEEVYADDGVETWEKLAEQAEKVSQGAEACLVPKSVKTFRYGEGKDSKRRRRMNLNYLGIKSAIAGWVRRMKIRFKQTKAWIKKTAAQIRDAIVKGLRSVTTFFRHSIDRIKRVFRVARAAVQRFYFWVAEKPFGTGDLKTRDFCLTRWSMDYDTVVVGSVACPEPLVLNHYERIRFLNGSFRFMIALALEALSILASLGMGNWLKLAWSLYHGIRKWSEWWKNNPFLEYTRGSYVT